MAELKDIKDKTPNAETIKMLEGLLESSKSGELRNVFIVCVWDCGTTTHGWAPDTRTNNKRALGELILLQNNLATSANIEDEGSCLSRIINDD